MTRLLGLAFCLTSQEFPIPRSLQGSHGTTPLHRTLLIRQLSQALLLLRIGAVAIAGAMFGIRWQGVVYIRWIEDIKDIEEVSRFLLYPRSYGLGRPIVAGLRF